jgi:hypothetical protein
MYTMFVSVFLLINGVPSDEPVAVLGNKTTFQTQDQCMNYFDTEKGAVEKQAVLEMIAGNMQNQEYSVGFSCVEKKGEAI